MAAYRYFSCVPGRVAHRFGSRSFIGATRGKDGYEWNEDEIVPIPLNEIRRYLREYNRLLRGPRPALIERTEKEYKAHAKAAEEAAQKRSEAADGVKPAEESKPEKPEKPAAADKKSAGGRSAGGDE